MSVKTMEAEPKLTRLKTERPVSLVNFTPAQPDLGGSFKPFSPFKDTVTIAEAIKPPVATIFESVLDQAQGMVKERKFKTQSAVNEGEGSLNSVSFLKLTQNSRGSERFRYRPRRPRRRRCPHNRLKTEGCYQCDEAKKKSKL